MALSQYIKRWKSSETKLDFDDFIQKWMNDPANYRCQVVTAVVTYWLDGVALEGFFIYEYR